jgi:predicted AAA+ superfamily ATPase
MADAPPIPRRAQAQLRAALDRSPIVLLTGARQTGKTSLATAAIAERPDFELASLDDAGTLALARRDPIGFLDSLGPRAVIDEAQRAPELLLAITGSPPLGGKPGHLLLTASASPLAMAGLAEWPAGLVETIPLHPLSQSEIRRTPERFVDAIFAGDPAGIPGGSRDEAIAAALVGGYPRVQSLGFERQGAWFRSYVSTVLDRDVRDLAQVGGLAPLLQLLGLLATRSGGPVNAAGLARDLAVPNTSLRRYLALLEAAHLVIRLPAWNGRVGRRLVKAARLFLADTGLMAHLALITEERLAQDSSVAGPLLETLAVLELLKQAGWSRTRPSVSHFRTDAGHEVDVLLQRSDGAIIGIDVRSAFTVGPADLRGLSALRDLTGGRFRRGVLLHLGRETVQVGDRLWAVPLAGLWSDAWEPSRAGSAASSA